MATSQNLKVSQGSDRQIDPGLIPAIADDGTLYPVGKMEAHRKGLYHVAVSVFIFSDDRLLVQRRAADKYHCGDMWANTCCSHPHWNETVEAAAARRLVEEIGLRAELSPGNTISYHADVTQGLIENEQVHVFHGRVDGSSCQLNLNSREVSETRWASIEDLLAELETAPDNFAPWFRIYLRRWSELGL